MKYKRQIATGALALSLLVGGSSAYAATPQDLGIKNVQKTYQKQNKAKTTVSNKAKTIVSRQHNAVGTVSVVNSTGFTLDVKNLKTKVTSSIDVKTDKSTVYTKDGASATVSDLVTGQKVIVGGTLDQTTNILTAKTVKIVTNKVVSVKKVKKTAN